MSCEDPASGGAKRDIARVESLLVYIPMISRWMMQGNWQAYGYEERWRIEKRSQGSIEPGNLFYAL